MTVLMNLVTRRRISCGLSVNFGSGRTLRLGTSPLRGISASYLLGALGAVLRTALAAVGDASGVEGSTDGVVTHAREVLDTTAADEDHRVLLEVVPFTRDVARDFHRVGETDAGDLAEGRVRLLGGRGVDAGADA